MAYRGSLRQCVFQMLHQFSLNNYAQLIITRLPTGKYYTLWPLEEYEEHVRRNKLTKHAPCIHLTQRELMQLMTTTQTDMFDKEAHADPTEAVPPRQ